MGLNWPFARRANCLLENAVGMGGGRCQETVRWHPSAITPPGLCCLAVLANQRALIVNLGLRRFQSRVSVKAPFGCTRVVWSAEEN